MQEIWKDIKGFEGRYQVSNLGRVKSFCKGKSYIKSQTLNYKGYLIVGLTKNKKTITKRIHRLVAEAFLPNPNNLLEVNHEDGNKLNNRVDNLNWCTRSYNVRHAWKNQLNRGFSKEVLQYDLQYNLINKFKSSSEASRILNINGGDIRACCLSIHNCKTAGGYIWRYANN